MCKSGKIVMVVAFIASFGACTKDELPRSNPFDQVGINANGSNGLAQIADGTIGQVYANGAEFSGCVYNEGAGNAYERGVCYNYSGNPSISFYRIISGSGAGDYSCSFSGLLPGSIPIMYGPMPLTRPAPAMEM